MASGEFRVVSWKLNKDFSIDVQGRTTTDSMYDLVAGPKPADVEPTPVPEEILYDTGVPGVVTGTPKLSDYGTYRRWTISRCSRTTSGNMNIVSAHEIAMGLYYVDELAADLWASIDAAIDAGHRSGYGGLHGQSGHGARVQGGRLRGVQRRGEESGRRVSAVVRVRADRRARQRRAMWCPPATSNSSEAYPGVDRGLRARSARSGAPHAKGIRFFKLDTKTFTYSVKKGFFRTPGLPARVEAKLPSACVVAVLVGVANNFGYGPFTVFPLAHHSEPFMPGDRTCNGGAYTFQIPGALAVADNVVDPDARAGQRVDPVHLCVRPDADHGRPERVPREGLARRRRDVGTAGVHGHRAEASRWLQEHVRLRSWMTGTASPPRAACRTTTSASFSFQNVTHGAGAQTVTTASYGANRLGFDVGEFVHVDLGAGDEEYVQVLAAIQPRRRSTRCSPRTTASARPCARRSGRLRSSTRATASRSISWRSPARTPAAT